MVLRIYADVFGAVNFIVDFALLYGTAIVTGTIVRPRRLFLGAVVGAVYATSALFSVWLRSSLGVLLGALATLAVAFWPTAWRRALAQGFTFISLAAVVAGLTMAIGQLFAAPNLFGWSSFGWPALLAALLSAVIGVAWVWRANAAGARVEGGIVQLEIRIGNELLTLTGLLDSGNLAREPISGHPVIIASHASLPVVAADGIWSSLPAGWQERFRLVPVRGLGSGPLLLPAWRIDSWRFWWNGRWIAGEPAYIAGYSRRLDPGRRWDALIPTLLVAPAQADGAAAVGKVMVQ